MGYFLGSTELCYFMIVYVQYRILIRILYSISTNKKWKLRQCHILRNFVQYPVFVLPENICIIFSKSICYSAAINW